MLDFINQIQNLKRKERVKISTTFKQIAMTSLVLGLSSFVLADDTDTGTPNGKGKGRTYGKKAPPEAPKFLGDKLPPYNNPNRAIVQASFIYWQADSDGFDVGVNQNIEIDGLGTTIVDGTATDIVLNLDDSLKDRGFDFKWDPGFKLGLGVVFGDKDEWELLLNWTWLQSKANSHSTGTQGTVDIVTFLNTLAAGGTANLESVIPSWSPLLLAGPSQKTDGKWRMHYNTVDLELGRNFFLGKTLALRPHIGLRGAWINQQSKVIYNSILNQLSSATSGTITIGGPSAIPSTFKAESKFEGVGLRGGADMYWNFTNHFCVFGKVSGAILYGYYEVEESINNSVNFGGSSIILPLPPITINGTTTLKDRFHRTRTNLEAALGLQWHTDFWEDKTHLFVSFSYEVNEWFQQNELRSIDWNVFAFLKSQRQPGDLGLHGITFDVRFDF